jgi:16S rRNA (cytidine1402-2'-O)-methyltransferase
MSSGAGSDGTEPELDPDILEELEFWIDPDEDRQPADGSGPEHRGEVADTPPAARAGTGAIVVVGTPIGNLGDLSPRAVQALRAADVIYCEDTRHSRKLLTHAGITGASLRSLHEHNEGDRIAEVLRAVGEGRTVAMVSDAGMPGISDPGRRVVAAAAEAGLTVSVIPGPSAVLAALVSSGLATDRFCFEGFLPRSGKDRRDRLETLGNESRTTVLYEAPGRVAGTLEDLVEECGANRQVVVARELTKLHEEIWRGSLAEAASWARAHPVRGEVALVLAGAPENAESAVSDEVLSTALVEGLGEGERTRGVVDEVAAAFGVPRRRVYSLALGMRDSTGPGGSTGTLPASE